VFLLVCGEHYGGGFNREVWDSWEDICVASVEPSWREDAPNQRIVVEHLCAWSVTQEICDFQMVGISYHSNLNILIRKALKFWIFHFDFVKRKLWISINWFLRIDLGLYFEKFRLFVNGLASCGFGSLGPSLDFLELKSEDLFLYC
jgi:hypothetical protein